jgi:hypothetical protein
MSSLFGGGGGGSQPPPYLPPPPPPPIPRLADYRNAPGADPTGSLIGNAGGTNKTGGSGLDTETKTSKKTLLGE